MDQGRAPLRPHHLLPAAVVLGHYTVGCLQLTNIRVLALTTVSVTHFKCNVFFPYDDVWLDGDGIYPPYILLDEDNYEETVESIRMASALSMV